MTKQEEKNAVLILPKVVNTELEQQQNMFIMCMGMGRDLFQHMREGMEFKRKVFLNNKYRINSIDNRATRKKKEKAKERELREYNRIVKKQIDVFQTLAESFCIQYPDLENELALKGYEVMENTFPIKKRQY